MHRLKWEWDSITTFNQFVASFVHPLRSKMSEVLVEEVVCFVRHEFPLANVY
jgi:hypothetical protein